jgi:hypothetical protein
MLDATPTTAANILKNLERVTGIEPVSLAWKARQMTLFCGAARKSASDIALACALCWTRMTDDTPSLQILAADARFDVRRVRARQEGDQWIAHVTCGMTIGACPRWRGTGPTRMTAIEAAAEQAVSYWAATAVAGEVRKVD